MIKPHQKCSTFLCLRFVAFKNIQSIFKKWSWAWDISPKGSADSFCYRRGLLKHQILSQILCPSFFYLSGAVSPLCVTFPDAECCPVALTERPGFCSLQAGRPGHGSRQSKASGKVDVQVRRKHQDRYSLWQPFYLFSFSATGFMFTNSLGKNKTNKK